MCCLKDKAIYIYIYIYDYQFWHEQNQPVVGVGGVGGVGGLRCGFFNWGIPKTKIFNTKMVKSGMIWGPILGNTPILGTSR